MRRHAWLLPPLLTALILAYGISQMVRADSMSGASGTSIDSAACVTTTSNSLCARVATNGTTLSTVSSQTTGLDTAACSTATANSLCTRVNTLNTSVGSGLGTNVTTLTSALVARTFVSTISPESVGVLMAASGSASGNNTTAWPTANGAIYVPVTFSISTTFGTGWINNGGTASGNVDIGLYSAAGSRLASTGSTAMSGTNKVQSIPLTASYIAAAGNYFLAAAVDNTLATWNNTSYGGNGMLPGFGLYYQTTAFALPATATFGSIATQSNRLYFFGLHNLSISP